MAKGKKLDLFIGADFDDGWVEVQDSRKTDVSQEILEASQHFLVFKKEKRRGKTLTLVGEFHLPKSDATAILTLLKKKLACGGSYKNGWMEFQGEVQERLRELLKAEGFRFKR